MNKRLVTLLFTFLLGTPMLASAQGTGVTLFGRVQTEYFSTKIDQASGGASAYRQEAIADNQDTSRWGLAITEDLGNGLSANARIEFSFRTGNGVAEGAREQWVGLSSKQWGALQFGRINGIFKDFVGGATLDPFLSTSLQARSTGGAMYSPLSSFGLGGFVDHAIRYNSPEFGGGFTAAVLLSPSDATQADPTTGTPAANGGNVGGRGGANNYQLALKYKFGPAGDVFVGYSQDDANNAQRSAHCVSRRPCFAANASRRTSANKCGVSAVPGTTAISAWLGNTRTSRTPWPATAARPAMPAAPAAATMRASAPSNATPRSTPMATATSSS